MLEQMKKSGIIAFSLLAPIHAAIATVFGLVVLDCITGILAAKKSGLPITSSGLKNSIIKLMVYEFAIILAYIIETYLVTGIPLTNMASSYVGLIELVSLNENVEIISGTKLLAGLIDRFKAKEEKKL